MDEETILLYLVNLFCRIWVIYELFDLLKEVNNGSRLFRTRNQG